MAYLYPAVRQIATTASTGIQSIDDLAGKRERLAGKGLKYV